MKINNKNRIFNKKNNLAFRISGIFLVLIFAFQNCSNSRFGMRAYSKETSKSNSVSGYILNRYHDFGDIVKISVNTGTLGAKVIVSTTGLGFHFKIKGRALLRNAPGIISICIPSNFNVSMIDDTFDLTLLISLFERQPCDSRKEFRSEATYGLINLYSYQIPDYFRLGVSIGLFLGVRVEVNPAELLDFVLGFVGLDLFNDDTYIYNPSNKNDLESIEVSLQNKNLLEIEKSVKDMSVEDMRLNLNLHILVLEKTYKKDRFFPAIKIFLEKGMFVEPFLNTAMAQDDMEGFETFAPYLLAESDNARICKEAIEAGSALGKKDMLYSIHRICQSGKYFDRASKRIYTDSFLWAKDMGIVNYLSSQGGDLYKLKKDKEYYVMFIQRILSYAHYDWKKYEISFGGKEIKPCFNGDYAQALNYFLSLGLNPNVVTNNVEDSPFQYAVKNLTKKDLYLIQILINHGGDPKFKEKDGRYLYESARDSDVRAYLENY